MLTNAKHNNFIAEWLTNGHNASEAYKTAYPNTKSGWNSHSARLMAKDTIKQEIARKQAVLDAKTEFTVAKAEQEYEEARAMAAVQGNTAAMISATSGKARLYAYDKQTVVTEHTPEQPVGAEAEAIEQAARHYKVKLSKQG